MRASASALLAAGIFAGLVAASSASAQSVPASATASALVQPMPTAWLRRCRASAAAPACPVSIQRSPLWTRSDRVFPPRIVRALGVTSFLIQADDRIDEEDGSLVCGEQLAADGRSWDYSGITRDCYERWAPARALLVWVSLSAGPILSTVHVEWKTRKLEPARVRDGVARAHGAVPLDFGLRTWGGRRGRLLLGPRPESDELVFVWGKGARQRAVGILVFEPLTRAVATLRAMVASVPAER